MKYDKNELIGKTIQKKNSLLTKMIKKSVMKN
jgi:hypothetical protein